MASSVTEGRHVVKQLHELFGSVLNLDVIESVALSFQYDVQKSSNKLLEISSVKDSSHMTYSNKNVPNDSFPIKQCTSTGALNKTKSKKLLEIERTIQDIRQGYKVLVIVRGLPGSGKSYLSKQIVQESLGSSALLHVHILSTDDYFVQRGKYIFDSSKLSEAHGWNHTRAFQAMSQGFSPVVIDNTNLQMWEMKAYASIATDYGYFIKILEPDNHWSFNDKELTKRNVHGVTRQKIKEMLERYDKNITTQKLLSAYSLTYTSRPPQFRTYPALPSRPVENFRHNDVSKQIICKSQSASALNDSYKPTKSDDEVEAINLMDFNDISPSGPKDQNYVQNNFNDNPLDEILMWNGHNDDILKPSSTQTNTIVIVDSDEDEEATHIFKNTDHNQKRIHRKSILETDIESAWGINESALRSWDIVTPLTDSMEVVTNIPDVVSEKVVSKVDAFSSTEDSLEDDDGVKIIKAYNRDINISTPKNTNNPIPKKIMVDQSCFTEDLLAEGEHISYLKTMFPEVSEKHLVYLYKHCKGDIDWTIDLMLENKDQLDMFLNKDFDEPPDESIPEPAVKTSADPVDNKIPQKRKYTPADELKTKLFTPSHYKANGSKNKPSTSNAEMVSEKSCDSDVDLEDLDFDDKNSDSGLIDTIELNLGEAFVEQLENQFGDPNFKYPKGFQPLVQVPVDLARQLYSLYIESVYQQMDVQTEVCESLIKEDEELAKKLQAQEQKKWLALEDHKNLSGQWKNLTPETLADKLTKEKLFNTFPTIDQNVLLEIYHAHNNVYQDTIDTLLASADGQTIIGSPVNIKEPPINEEIMRELKDAHETSKNYEIPETRQDARTLRERANKHLQKRGELHQKAQSYYQRGMNEVAQFYSDLASKQTQFFDNTNQLAAEAFLNEHSNRLQEFNTLDLHYLYVKEAIPALDLFIDRNINLLRGGEKQSEFLHIITGRGKRSQNGVSKIKPAVITRIRKRGLRYHALNPGLLRIRITKTSRITSDIDS